MSQLLGTSTIEMWVHRSKKQQKQSFEQKEKRTVDISLPQPTKPRTSTPPSVTFVPTLPYIPETTTKALSNPPPQLMIAETLNIFPSML